MSQFRFALSFVAALSFGVASVAHAQPAPENVPQPPQTTVDLEAVLRGDGRGLTADAAAARAIATAPSMDRAQAAVRAARAGADRALYGFIPQLALTARYTRLSEIQNAAFISGPSIDPAQIDAIVAGVQDPVSRELWRASLTAQAELTNFRFPVLLDNYAFRASLTVPVSDIFLTIWPAYEGAQAGALAADASVRAQREEVAYSAREAFYNYARARGALAVAQIALEQAETRHRQVQAFVAAGTAAPVDELRIRAQVAATRVAIARANSGVTVAATAVRTLLHVEQRTEIAVGEDVLVPLPPLDADADALVARALRDRHEVRALRRIIDANNHQVVAAEGSRWPHLVVAANLDVSNPNQRIFPQTAEFRESWDVSALVTWSLHDTLNGEALANESRARRDQARADLAALEDGIRLQVIEAASAYTEAREALDSARLGVEAAQESHRVQMERYRAGAATVTEVIDASAEQVRAQLDLVTAAIASRLANARLRRALAIGAR